MKIIFGSIAILIGSASLGFAQTTPALTDVGVTAAPLFNVNAHAPDVNTTPVLANLVKSGGKLYFIGERSGMPGWFIIKDGQVQIIYLSPDRQTALIGGMFSVQGENVTTPQISALVEKNAEVKALLSGSAQQQREVYNAGAPDGAGSVPAGEQSAEPASKNGQGINGMPSASLSPGERLMQDLKAAAGVTVGQNESAELIMVVAPGCPNCKRTWLELRDSVKANKIQVRLIPVYNSTGGEEIRVAAQLLKTPNPLDAWNRYVDGDQTALAGEPDDMARRAVIANLNLVAKWNIQGYPYLVYRGKDGRIKIVQGKPERMAAVLTDLSR
ncbi:MAG: hypothetical protein WC612_01295 [Bdellovibrionales bacterium]